MDIRSNGNYPSNILSNFAPHSFVIDGVECNSLEGWLQSLKFKSIEMQIDVCKLVGLDAKTRGSHKKWYTKQVLYWQGEEINRDSIEYQKLLDRAYTACYKHSKSFRKALAASIGATLTHSIGNDKKNETILTIYEFCSRLKILRDYGEIIR